VRYQRERVAIEYQPVRPSLRRVLVAAVTFAAACGGAAPARTPGGRGPQPVVRADAGRDAAPFAAVDLAPLARDAASSPDAASVDAGSFQPAAHLPFPTVPNAGGPTMAAPELVTITYSDETHRTTLESFGAWIVKSQWLSIVGADYGVGLGSVLGHARLTTKSPATINLTGIEDLIAAGVQAGTIPSPSSGDLSNVLYVVYFPTHTKITAVDASTGQSSTGCTDWIGWHDHSTHSTPAFAFAIVPLCVGATPGLTDLESQEDTASHEVIETATNPDWFKHPAWVLPASSSSPWYLTGGEVGDLCAAEPAPWREAGFVAQRIWSNGAIARDPSGDPCVPALAPTPPYYSAAAAPGDEPTVAAGGKVSFAITGWSTAALAPWQLSASTSDLPATSLTLGAATIENGGTTTLDVHVPAGTASGSEVSIAITSTRSSSDFHVWYTGLRVQ
jgi:hypothetical protein